MVCSDLRQRLDDESGARRVAQRDVEDAKAETQQLRAELKLLQERHKAQLKTQLQQKEDELTTQFRGESQAKIDAWKAYYTKQLAGLQDQLNAAPQAKGSSGPSSALESELASARQQIADLQRLNSEEGAAEQRAAEAHSRITQLETQLAAAQAEASSSAQLMQEARKGVEEASAQLREAHRTIEDLRAQLHKAKQEHENSVQEMVVQVAKYAKEYAIDLAEAKAHHHDSGGHNNKRSRDHSNGRDSKRRG